MVKRYTRKRHLKNKKYKKMRGGAFSQTELQQLQNNGFNEEQIQVLQQMNVPFNSVMTIINQLTNQGPNGFHGNADDFAELASLVDLISSTFIHQRINLGVSSGVGRRVSA